MSNFVHLSHSFSVCLSLFLFFSLLPYLHLSLSSSLFIHLSTVLFCSLFLNPSRSLYPSIDPSLSLHLYLFLIFSIHLCLDLSVSLSHGVSCSFSTLPPLPPCFRVVPLVDLQRSSSSLLLLKVSCGAALFALLGFSVYRVLIKPR